MAKNSSSNAPLNQTTRRQAETAEEPIPFDDALRVLLAAPPQHKAKPKDAERPRSKRSKKSGKAQG